MNLCKVLLQLAPGSEFSFAFGGNVCVGGGVGGEFCNSRVNDFLTPRLASKGLTSSLKGEMYMFPGLFQLKTNDATRSEGMQGTDDTL